MGGLVGGVSGKPRVQFARNLRDSMGQGQNTEQRCGWCLAHPDYVRYHDEEWGRPLRDPDQLFELLMLEGMQAGLSWWTVLQKREHMRARFFGFDAADLASKGQRRMNNWLADTGLIRHRGKLEALITNARAFLAIEDFSDFVWQTVDGEPVVNRFRTMAAVPASTEASE